MRWHGISASMSPRLVRQATWYFKHRTRTQCQDRHRKPVCVPISPLHFVHHTVEASPLGNLSSKDLPAFVEMKHGCVAATAGLANCIASRSTSLALNPVASAAGTLRYSKKLFWSREKGIIPRGLASSAQSRRSHFQPCALSPPLCRGHNLYKTFLPRRTFCV